MRPLIVGFGEALIDRFQKHGHEVVGGAPLNFAVRAAELGTHFDCDAALVTRIGDDERGHAISQRLERSALLRNAVQVDPNLPTGVVEVNDHDASNPTYTIGRNVAWDAIAFDDTVQSLAERAAVVCYGTLVQLDSRSQATLTQFLSVASSATKILDLNLRKPLPTLDTVSLSLEHADVLKCNLEELQQLAAWFELPERLDGQVIAARLQSQFGLRAVFWTRGPHGCCWQDGNTCYEAEVPRFESEPKADSVGAGDAACAALAIGLVLDWAPDHIVRAANRCGAFVASRQGATTPLDIELIRSLRQPSK